MSLDEYLTKIKEIVNTLEDIGVSLLESIVVW